MNDLARRMIMDRQRRMQDSARRNMDYERDGGDYARGSNRARDYESGGGRYRNRDYEDGRDYEMRRRRGGDMRLADPIGTEAEYPFETDGKQGVKGTGPYGIGGRLYSRGRDYERDEEGYYEMDGGHPSGLMKLKKKDFMKWERQLENTDGTHGKHFDMQQITRTAEQLGIKFKEYDEKELCMAVNMLYSDYAEALKSVIPPDRELITYVKLGQAWLEDPDSPVEGSEKLALYYWCIVSDEE